MLYFFWLESFDSAGTSKCACEARDPAVSQRAKCEQCKCEYILCWCVCIHLLCIRWVVMLRFRWMTGEKEIPCKTKEVEKYLDFLRQDENSNRWLASRLTLLRICFRDKAMVIFLLFYFFYPHYRCAVPFQMGWLARAQVWHWPLLHLPPSGAVAGCNMTSEVAPVRRRG